MTRPVTFTKESAKRIAKATRAVEAAGLDISRTPRRGASSRLRDNVEFHNQDTAAAPANAVIWLYEYRSDYSGFNAKRVEYPGITRIGIVAGAVASGDQGNAWQAGYHNVLCSAYASVPILSRIGAVADSWYAAAHDLGQMLVVGSVPAGDQPSGLPAGVGLLRVRLDAFRVY